MFELFEPDDVWHCITPGDSARVKGRTEKMHTPLWLGSEKTNLDFWNVVSMVWFLLSLMLQILLERYFSTQGLGTEIILPKSLDLQEKLKNGAVVDPDFSPGKLEEYYTF